MEAPSAAADGSASSRIRPEAARLAAEAPAVSDAKRALKAPKRLATESNGPQSKRAKAKESSENGDTAGSEAKKKPAPLSKGGKANATYQEMITRALQDMNDRNGSSVPAGSRSTHLDGC